MKISELARCTNTSVRSLRYYESKRLLTAHRQENGYRFYDPSAIEQGPVLRNVSPTAM